MEEITGCIAFAEVAMDKLDSHMTAKEQKCKSERWEDKEIEEMI